MSVEEFAKATGKSVGEVEKDVEKSGESGIIKSIDIDDFATMAKSHNIQKEVSDVIANTIRDYEDKGGMYISDMHFGDFYDSVTHKRALFQVLPNAYGLTEINVNSDILAGRTVEEINKQISATTKNLPRNLKEVNYSQ